MKLPGRTLTPCRNQTPPVSRQIAPRMLSRIRIGGGEESWAAGCGTEQIPTVALEVEEHRYLTIRLGARRGDEPDVRGAHPRVGSVEVIDAQEQSNPARELIA